MSNEDKELWQDKADLLQSGLEFARAVEEVAHDIIVEMVASGDPVGVGQFKTPGGREASVVIAVGDDKTKDLLQFAEVL